MDRRVTWADKQTELEIQTFNLFPDRWAEIYRERLLGGGSGAQTSYAPGDYGLAFNGEAELPTTIDDLHSLDDWVDGMNDTRRMSGGMVPAQDVSAVLGYVAPGDKGRRV